ncbi:MAG: hypothetical protein Q9184_001830 [Pyrenodesmia sp. 2 TL-2023]
MAFPVEKFDHRRTWKLVVRIVALLAAIGGVGCVAYMLYQLRRWKNDHQEGDYQADEFILAWLVLTLALSALLSTTAIFTHALHSTRPVLPSTVTLATDVLLTLSLLASGIWLCLAATTDLDGNTALNIRFYRHDPYEPYTADYYARAINMKSALELVGIVLTFLAAYAAPTPTPSSRQIYMIADIH